jgi:myo-inositol-1(or 4)-monophosphatase
MPVLLGSRWEIEEGVLRRYESTWQLTAMGSTAYRMLKVADGTGHAFVSPARKHEWDVCAAALVVTEAGGRVGSGTGAELRFNRKAPVLQGIMAWSPAVRPEPPTASPSRATPAGEEERS